MPLKAEGAFFIYKELQDKWFGNGCGGYGMHQTHCLSLVYEYLPFEKHWGSHVLSVEPQLLGGRNSELTLKKGGRAETEGQSEGFW